MNVILAVVLLIGLIPMQSMALEPVRIPEDDVVAETAESGAFYLASSSAKLSENSPAPYYLRVARGGSVPGEYEGWNPQNPGSDSSEYEGWNPY